jgi:hypothetical protein
MALNWVPVMRIRAVCYSAFSSPGFGITWSLLTLLSGFIYLIYEERKRGNFPAGQAKSVIAACSCPLPK